MEILTDFFDTTGFASMQFGNAIMILIGIVFIVLAITKDYEPLLLVPILLIQLVYQRWLRKWFQHLVS